MNSVFRPFRTFSEYQDFSTLPYYYSRGTEDYVLPYGGLYNVSGSCLLAADAFGWQGHPTCVSPVTYSDCTAQSGSFIPYNRCQNYLFPNSGPTANRLYVRPS